MKYMLLIYLAEKALTDSEREYCYQESAELARDLQSKGKYISANSLQDASTARSLRIRDGKRFMTDGPFAETRELLGGYYLIEARDMDEAIGVAERIPGARAGTIEIRPVRELSGMPKS